MALNIVVAIGGTGARVAEAYVYAVASGLLNSYDKTEIYVVDKDINCGNTQRLMKTINEYNDMRLCTGLDLPEIEQKEWCIEAAMKELDPSLQQGGSATYGQVACTPGTKDSLLVNLMHSQQEQEFNLQQGFYGHPSLGAALYGMITETPTFNSDAGNTLVASIKHNLANNEVNTFFVGSLFGGTGASLLPNVARTLQENKNIGRSPRYRQGAAMMLPYFTFQPANHRDTAAVNSATFNEKTATALDFYERSDSQYRQLQKQKRAELLASGVPNPEMPLELSCLISNDYYTRDRFEHTPAVFDDLYLFGLEPLEPTCGVYAEGGSNQVHSFSIADFYAALSAVEFFNKMTVRVNNGTPHLYSADMPTDDISWPQIPNPVAQPRIEQMVRFCDAFLTFLYPMFAQDRRELMTLQYLKNIYGTVGTFGKYANLPEGLDFGQEVQRIAPFCEKYMGFFADLQNRNDTVPVGSVNLFTAMLRNEHDFLLDPNYQLLPLDWFRANYNMLRTGHFHPDMLLLGNRRTAVPDAVALQQRLGKYKLDLLNYPGLPAIYRAVFDLMRV